MKRRSVVVDGRKTSVSLEDEFWNDFKQIAAAQDKPVVQLLDEINTKVTHNLSSAIRLYVLSRYRPEANHKSRKRRP